MRRLLCCGALQQHCLKSDMPPCIVPAVRPCIGCMQVVLSRLQWCIMQAFVQNALVHFCQQTPLCLGVCVNGHCVTHS